MALLALALTLWSAHTDRRSRQLPNLNLRDAQAGSSR